VGDPWDDLLAFRSSEGDSGVDEDLEAALLSYKQKKAARWGAERFADELRRRDEAEEARPVWTSEALSAPVEASVEAQVVGGEPAAFRPEPPRIGFDPSFVIDPPGTAIDGITAETRPVTEPLVPDIDVPVQSEERLGPELEIEAIVEEAVEPEVLVDVVPEVGVDVAPEVGLPPVELPRFAPDEAWSAGSRAGKLERLPAALRNPHVPRPPAPDPQSTAPSRHRWRGKRATSEPVRTAVITPAEWARMSPGARRLYGLEDPPEELRAG
jgi:hypothetical protein